MFEDVGDAQRSSWVVPFVAQQLLAGLGPLLLLGVVAKFFGNYQQAGAQDVGVIYVIIAAVSFSLGYGVARAVPRSVVTGRWIWVAPVCLLLAALADELWMNARVPYGQHAFRRTMAELFCPSTVSGYVEMTLFTIPAWSCLCYVLGVMTTKRKNART
jgi:hypothetical protein